MRSVLLQLALLPLFLWCPPPLALAADYAQDFSGAALRFDYHHGGDSKSEWVAADALLREGEWAGSRTHLTDFPDYGKYRFSILNASDRRVLFEQGYSTLFGEWQTTDEALSARRVFHESLRFPEPAAPFLIRILARNAQGRFTEVYLKEFDPASHLVRTTAPMAVEIVATHVPAQPHRCLDIVVVADGYTPEQMPKARRDLARYAQVFLTTPPFASHSDELCLRGVLAPAVGTGPDEPRKGLFVAPPAGTTFNTFDSPRYLTTLNNKALRDLSGQVPYDAIYVMVNASRYGGAGIYNFFSIFVTDNEYDEYVFIHEFGHGFAGLGDEYYTSSVAYSDFYPKGVEPWEPNVTAALDGPTKVKWSSLMTTGVPLPTPEHPEYAGKVGLFEGAGYSAKGLYRPALDCKMMSKKRLDFCPVCMAATEAMIRLYVE